MACGLCSSISSSDFQLDTRIKMFEFLCVCVERGVYHKVKIVFGLAIFIGRCDF